MVPSDGPLTIAGPSSVLLLLPTVLHASFTRNWLWAIPPKIAPLGQKLEDPAPVAVRIDLQFRLVPLHMGVPRDRPSVRCRYRLSAGMRTVAGRLGAGELRSLECSGPGPWIVSRET